MEQTWPINPSGEECCMTPLILTNVDIVDDLAVPDNRISEHDHDT